MKRKMRRKNPHFKDSEYSLKKIDGHLLQLISKISAPAHSAQGVEAAMSRGETPFSMLSHICYGVSSALRNLKDLVKKLKPKSEAKLQAKIDEEIKEVEEIENRLRTKVKRRKSKKKSRRYRK